MAEVFLTMIGGPTGSGFTKLAVVKRLRPNLVEDPDFVAMLVDGARISARLSHPNVVQTLEVGVEGEEYFLAMEFLDGQPLHRIQRRAIRSGTALPAELGILIVADVLAGLHHAHELADYDGSPLGIVHRDVTPQNVFVTYDGTVKVVDFGIAKAAGRAQETKQGIVKGKVRYMSPEQALGKSVDRRSDVFAAGILLWEAVTGMRFWSGQDDMMIIHRLVAGTYDSSPRAVNPNVAVELDAMCCRAMAHRAEDRYESAEAMRLDLHTYLANGVIHARRELGPLVTSMFAAERTQVREVIERAGRASAEAPSVAVLISAQSLPAMSTHSSSTQVMATSIGPPGFRLVPPSTSSLFSLLGTPDRHAKNLVAYASISLVLAASVLFIIALRTDSFEGLSSGSGRTAHRRTPAVAQSSRTDLVLRSATQTAFRPDAPPPTAGRRVLPVPPRPTDEPSPSTAELPAPPPPPVQPTHDPEMNRKRMKPAIDTGDPWPAQGPKPQEAP